MTAISERLASQIISGILSLPGTGLPKTIGIQFTNAVDSNSANIAEGFGRYGKKDKIKFYYYSFGSVKENLDWNEKAKVRKLLTKDQYDYILKELQSLLLEIHQLIKYTNLKLEK